MPHPALTVLLALVWWGGAAADEIPADEIPVLAASHEVAPGETLLDLARDHGLGYVEILAANPGVDPFLPEPGTRILLPVVHLPPFEAAASDAALVVNLADMRLYHRREDGTPASYPVGIGREGRQVSAGLEARVTAKRVDPVWVPPRSIRAEKPWLPEAVPPGPDNPMGSHSLDLDVGLLRIHGTNQPDGIGRRVSAGCLRLYPEDIETLFGEIAVGTPITFVDEPAKLGWVDGELWLEIHPTQAQADAVEYRRPPPAAPLGVDVEALVRRAAGKDAGRIDWTAVRWTERTRLGIPVQITLPAP